MLERLIQKRRYIRELKTRKKKRLERIICTSCGRQGHQSGRSWSCPNNVNYGRLTREQIQQQERQQRQEGRQLFKQETQNPVAYSLLVCGVQMQCVYNELGI